jgi:hypothetical protein
VLIRAGVGVSKPPGVAIQILPLLSFPFPLLVLQC